MSARSPRHDAAACLALGAGAALLVLACFAPARGLCGPLVPPGQALIAAAQVLGFIAFASFRRGGRRGAAAAGAAAWACLGAAPLLVRTCAGHLESLRPSDVAHAVLAALALAMLLFGLTSDVKGLARGILAASLACVAGLGAARLMDGRAVDRTWLTWARLQDAAAVIAPAQGEPLPPGEAVALGSVAQALAPSLAEGLPTHDAWGRPLLYTLDGRSVRLESRGADGERGPYSEGASRDFADDLVIVDGVPVAWPEKPCAPGPRPAPARQIKDMRTRPRP